MTVVGNLKWRTSSRSGTGGEKCVEVAPTSSGAIIRHSKYPAAGTISFTHDAWRGFVSEALTGSASNNDAVQVERTVDGGAVVRSPHDGLELHFDGDEWSAFVSGAQAGEFDFRGSTPAELG